MKVFGKIKPGEYAMFIEAWSCLAMARLMLVFRPFKKILPFLKSGEKIGDLHVNGEILHQIKLSIARACNRSPWRTKCFEQALAAKMMLNKRKIAGTIFFGVKKENTGELAAHAWVKSGEFIVTGWQQVKEYTVVGSF